MLYRSSSPLVKSWNISDSDATITIDSNERVAAKIGQIAEKLEQESIMEEGFSDSFSEGLEADEVAALLSDDESGNIIPAQPQYDGPSVEELVAQAQAEIEQMREDAMQEIEAIRVQTTNEANTRGHAEGFEQGYREGLQKAQEAEDEMRMQFEAKQTELLTDYESKLAEMEPALMEVLVGVFEQIFRVEFGDKKETLLHMIENTLHRVEGSESYMVRVSGEDFEFVSANKTEVLQKCIPESARLEVIEDVMLCKNECMIETSSGIFDCGIDTQLTELRKRLMLLSYEG